MKPGIGEREPAQQHDDGQDDHGADDDRCVTVLGQVCWLDGQP
jgi:hypothetical protein